MDPPKCCEFCGGEGAVTFVAEWLRGESGDYVKVQDVGGWACGTCAAVKRAEIARYECRSVLPRDGYGRQQIFLHMHHAWLTPVPQFGVIEDECKHCQRRRPHS